jgi:hypothetical protein
MQLSQPKLCAQNASRVLSTLQVRDLRAEIVEAGATEVLSSWQSLSLEPEQHARDSQVR